ncbi:motile sperm domain-containing protein 2-like isoform X1 [Leptotrombidium deliense]|uniref:Motile sperm domain-containing protein 2-like isoform X1 n=1 Tax=Leptotrombidium deliense TaxID=299467 RepID=A0A443SJZ6_9ACAR|nr:motile sperm domain-containing protein 2-like isoform X1 [Leptotrombidium deliense]
MPSKIFLNRQISSTNIFNEAEVKLIDEVRSKVMKIYESDKTLFNEKDVEDLEVKRLIHSYLRKQNYDVLKTVEMIKKSLIQLKAMNSANIEYNSYPREYFETGGIFIEHGIDFEGNVVVYARAKFSFITNETKDFYERLWSFVLNTAFKKAIIKNKKLVIVADHTGFSLENVSATGMSLAFNNIKIFKRCVPDSLHRLLYYNIPWIAKATLKLFSRALPNDVAKLIEIVDSNSITQFIPESNLPNFIKNPDEYYDKPFPQFADDLDSIDLEKIGVRTEDKEKLRDLFQKIQEKNEY